MQPVITSQHINLEHVCCPRCGSADSSLVYTASDYIYGVPGEFYASACKVCGLWYQNPRPVVEQLAELYPDTYGPHSRPAQEAAPQTADGHLHGCPPIYEAKPSGLCRMIKRVRRSLKPVRAFVNRVVAPIRDLACNAWRGWLEGALVHGLGYQQLKGTGFVRRVALRLGSIFSFHANWRYGVYLVPRFVHDGRLLEIGCGNGDALLRLRSLGWSKLTGIELVPAAATLSRQYGFDVVTAAVEDALLAFPDNYFDAILSTMVLEHLVNPFETMKVIARKLKPGGQLLFSTVIRDSIDGRIFGAYGVSFDFPRHMVFFQKRDLLDLLEQEFSQIECFHQNSPIDFIRPSRLRRKRIDRWILRFFRLPGAAQLVWCLARIGLMGRVSIRCVRKDIISDSSGRTKEWIAQTS